jgi:hypothetical protein
MTQPFDNRDWDLHQIAEKDAEIERLKREVAFMASNDYVHSLISLITRAADALENCLPALNAGILKITSEALITELRKAAQ